MTVVLINPNSTASMTASALKAVRLAAPEIAFEGWTSHDGPASIEGEADGQAAVPPLMKLVRKASRRGAAAIIIACFDDTGLDEARRIANCPVIGIGQSSFVTAGLLTDRAAVITTVEAAVPIIEKNIACNGLAGKVGEVRAAGISVLSLERCPDLSAQAFIRAAGKLRPGTDVIILGCAGAVEIIAEVNAALPYRVLDGVTCAGRLCRALFA